MRLRIFSLLLVAVLSTGCAAASFGSNAVSPADTAQGLWRAVQNAPGTFMMASDKLIMVAWPQSGQYGFVVFSKDGNAVKEFAELASCLGNKAGCESMSDLVNYLKSIGWTRIWQLPPTIVQGIKSLAEYFAGGGVATEFSLFVVPAGALSSNILDEMYPQIDG